MNITKLSPKQKMVFKWCHMPETRNKYSAIICDGAVRSGKTVCMIVSFVHWAMRFFDGAIFGICGKTVQSVERNIVMPLQGMRDVTAYYTLTYTRSTKLVTVTGNGHINSFYVFGGKDESSYMLIQSITLSGVLFDEVALMPRSFVEQAIARTVSVSQSKLWFNCNPDSPSHWFYKKWIENPQPDTLHLHFMMDDNPIMTPEAIAKAESRFSGVFYERYILGRWVLADGLVYPMFDKNQHVIHEIPEYSPRHRYYVSIDYGTVNPFAAGLYDYNPAVQTAVQIKELYYKGGSTKRVDNETYYRMLCELIGDIPIEYIIIDPSASSMIETIQKYGLWMIVKANNDVINGIQNVTKFLNAGVLKFHESCVNKIMEFGLYSWDEKAEEDRGIKENDHAMDELRYLCSTALCNELKWII